MKLFTFFTLVTVATSNHLRHTPHDFDRVNKTQINDEFKLWRLRHSQEKYDNKMIVNNRGN